MLVTSIDVGPRNFVITVSTDNESSSLNDNSLLFLQHVDFQSVIPVVVIEKLLRYLNKPELEIALKVDKVAIESQFKGSNIVEKVWAATWAFFEMKRAQYGYKMINVSPARKFRFYKGPPIPYKKGKTAYLDRKAKLIAEGLHLMASQPKNKVYRDFIMEMEKQDDPIDAIVQSWVILYE